MTGRSEGLGRVRRAWPAVLVATVVAAFGVPIGVIAWSTHEVGTVYLEPDRVAWAPVRASTEAPTTDVDIALRWSAGELLVAPSWSGLVEELILRPGTAVHSGDAVAVVGGVTRLAFASSRPFARPLGRGDHGPDVAALEVLLRARGLRAGAGDTFDERTSSGVSALAASIGAGAVDVFDPSWVVYLPEGEVDVDTSSLVVGAPAPPAGTPIATGRQRLVGATLAPAGTASTAPTAGGPSAAAPAAPAPSTGFTAPAGATLDVDGSPLALTEDRAAVVPDALDALAELVTAGAPGIRATLRQPIGADDLAVPTASVFAASDGSLCVRRRRPGGAAGVVVRVVGERAGATIVHGPLRPGDDVAVAPPASLRSCSSS